MQVVCRVDILYIYTYTCGNVFIFIYVCYVYICVCLSVRTYIYIYVCVYLYTCVVSMPMFRVCVHKSLNDVFMYISHTFNRSLCLFISPPTCAV